MNPLPIIPMPMVSMRISILAKQNAAPRFRAGLRFSWLPSQPSGGFVPPRGLLSRRHGTLDRRLRLCPRPGQGRLYLSSQETASGSSILSRSSIPTLVIGIGPSLFWDARDSVCSGDGFTHSRDSFRSLNHSAWGNDVARGSNTVGALSVESRMAESSYYSYSGPNTPRSRLRGAYERRTSSR